MRRNINTLVFSKSKLWRGKKCFRQDANCQAPFLCLNKQDTINMGSTAFSLKIVIAWTESQRYLSTDHRPTLSFHRKINQLLINNYHHFLHPPPPPRPPPPPKIVRNDNTALDFFFPTQAPTSPTATDIYPLAFPFAEQNQQFTPCWFCKTWRQTKYSQNRLCR